MSVEQGLQLPHGVTEVKGQNKQNVMDATPQTEHVLFRAEEVAKKVTDAWFEPKNFEMNSDLYEKLGVRTYKKFLPAGDLMMRLSWKYLGDGIVKPGNTHSLKLYEASTRVFETVHSVGFGVMSALAVGKVASGDMKEAALITGLNTVANVYPVMVQRYNRSRVFRIMNNIEERNTLKEKQSSTSVE